MPDERAHVITIAGFDPSAGAGVLADIKTFEILNVYGFGVCTAITVQHESAFKNIYWIRCEEILEQLKVLVETYPVKCLKIGLVQNFDVLEMIVDYVEKHYQTIKIIWDPILKASAGFQFHSAIPLQQFLRICRKVYIITPNEEEIRMLTGNVDALAAAKMLGREVNVFLKSYQENGKMFDILVSGNDEYFFETEIIPGLRKHGSGCVLSSAILSFIASNYDLKTSCELARKYISQFLRSSEGLLGIHQKIKLSEGYV